jgi:release factor glutamine methyltransferase
MKSSTPHTLGNLLAEATRRLEAVTETPRLDTEILLAHALGYTRAQLLARLRETRDVSGFEALIERRLAYEPIAYILGEWEFFSLSFCCRTPVLVPRPETEHLVEVALEYLGKASGQPRVLDLCTGTGCVAISIAHTAPQAHITATDLSTDALALARENAARHGVPLDLFQGDLFSALPPDTPPFDLIVANPPYVEESDWPELSPVIRIHEDPQALLAGPDGLDFIRRIITDAPAWLKPGGLIALETGERQFETVHALFATAGFTNIAARNDLAAIPRIIYGAVPA